MSKSLLNQPNALVFLLIGVISNKLNQPSAPLSLLIGAVTMKLNQVTMAKLAGIVASNSNPLRE
jgi:hypothetical protein